MHKDSNIDNGVMSDNNIIARGCAFEALVGSV